MLHWLRQCTQPVKCRRRPNLLNGNNIMQQVTEDSRRLEQEEKIVIKLYHIMLSVFDYNQP